MKVIVISDMEGISGIVRGEQTHGGSPMYEEGRKLYTAEMNAAVAGAKAAGATEIVLMDHHGAGGDWSFNSLIPEELDPDCEYVVQQQWTEYTGFLEEGVDACLLVGMHSMAGTAEGLMNHTVSGPDYQNLWFNGTKVGETGINAALCGTWGCPVVLVTGDDAACVEGRELLGDGVTTVEVKRGLGRPERAPARAEEGPRARARRRGEGARRPEGRRAVRPRQAVRDQGRLQVDGPCGEAERPAGDRGRRPEDDPLARRRLVDGVEAVLLLGTGPARELADAVSSAEAVPGSGWVAAVSASLAAGLVAKSAARSEGWSGAEGAHAQAVDLRDRLLGLADRDARAYERALTALERRGANLARALASAAEAPARDRRDRE